MQGFGGSPSPGIFRRRSRVDWGQSVRFSRHKEDSISGVGPDILDQSGSCRDGGVLESQRVGDGGSCMRVCVQGLWHLGSVTAACLASVGHEVIGLDLDSQAVAGLRNGVPPVMEPGLAELIKDGLATGRLTFSEVASEALEDVDVLWVAYDTPVDEDDVADVEFVIGQVDSSVPCLK